MTSAPDRRIDAVIQPFAWVWMGIVIGVSFLATPIKFTADSITRPVALDVGRATFHALGYVEWTLTVVLAVVIWRAATTGHRPSNRSLAAFGVVAIAVALQAMWLVPALDDRVASIIAGTEPPPSHLHTMYGIAEVAKVGALGVLGVFASPAPLAPAAEVETQPTSGANA